MEEKSIWFKNYYPLQILENDFRTLQILRQQFLSVPIFAAAAFPAMFFLNLGWERESAEENWEIHGLFDENQEFP